MEKIYVKGAELCTNKGVIKLSGVSIPDFMWLIDKENQDIEGVIKKIKSLGFNCVRVPILPGNFIFYENYIEKTISQIVDLCAKYELYCILDWHAIGNPLHDQTRLKKYFHLKDDKQIFWYSADLKLANEGISVLARLFGKKDNIIFEIYNEPCPSEKDVPQLELSALPWNEWRKMAQKLITTVREHSDNLLLVSSNYWSFNLKSTSEDPFTDFPNLAYSFHCYPFKNNQNWKEMLDSMSKFPVVVTEFGYDTEEKSQYNSSYEEYLRPLMEYLTKYNISWIGWCFSESWRPRIVANWEPFRLSDFGERLIKYLN